MIQRVFFALIVLVLLPVATLAQSASPTSEDDRGYLQAFLEDNLSDTGRDIRITGFQGAFNSKATVDEITIADGEGIWLSMRGLTLTWTRSALLTGNVKIDALEADEINLLRRPIPEPGLPSPEATEFSLPELPVSLNIGVIRAKRVILGETVIGAAATISLEGSASLASGKGEADLQIKRLDGPKGDLSMSGNYDNVERVLSMSLSLQEAADGIAANLLGIPDRPSMGLTVEGTGPLSDFTADIALATAGQDRLTGKVALLERTETEGTTPTTATERQYALDLSGDITALLHPDYHGFFGETVDLTARAVQQADGSTRIDALSLQSASMDIQGNLVLSPAGWPERVAVEGKIASQDGGLVHLPIAGDRTQVSSVDLKVDFDASTGDQWIATANLKDLTREDLTVQAANLNGSGVLRAGKAGAPAQIDGRVGFDVAGVLPQSPELAAAVGSDVLGQVQFDWQDNEKLALSDLKLTGTDYDLTGALSLSDFADGIIARSDGLRLSARDLSRFSGVIGAALTGEVGLDVEGESNLLGGAFDIRLNGDGSGIGVNQPELDQLIGGQSKLAVEAIRDTNGTRIALFDLSTEKAKLSATADLKTDASVAKITLDLPDASAVDASLRGPAKLIATARQTGDDWQLDADMTAPGDANINAAALIKLADGQVNHVEGSAQGQIGSLAPYRGLAKRPVSGALTFEAKGQMQPEHGAFTMDVNGSGQSIGTGIAQVDAILRGASTYSLAAHREEDKAPVLLDRLSFRSTALDLNAEGLPSNGSTRIAFQSRLTDVGLLAEGMSGPAQAEGEAQLDGDDWRLSLNATGPAGVNARVTGSVKSDASQADLDLSGSAPLALANTAIKPRLATGTASYDLTLRGPLALASVSGTIATQNARVALPRLKQSIDINSGQVSLSGGQATLDIQSSIAAGGRVSTTGTIGLAPPMQANLDILLDQLRLTDGELFETTMNGTAGLQGPLQGGATLRAALNLGRTEIRVPETTAGTLPVMEGLAHVGEPASVRQTRKFAGLIVPPASAAPGRPYPLDITLSAPGQIFVRGRGLDAELGGALRVTGNSANVIPQGEFNLIRGRLDILGKRLTLTEGDVSLQGNFNPYLHFLAEARAEDADVYIGVDGPASSPEISFTSSPALPEDEVLARLLFGKDITQISAIQALRLAAAVRTLAGKGGEGVLGKLRNNFALDDLDVTTDETGAASVRAGKYISENIYTDVTVGAEGKAEVNLNLTITPSLTARGTLGSDGDTGIGIYYERDY
ncbi:translocation/assembly module TamB domain-containing protein [Aliiroseovarius sp. F20344]|uniref:translocation/assembly module TamB domain-containing protein n=1 Tax=Aliiroseovarius sp. F20344 TaxID=2926414 RepID=UPI001FF23D33|nr:translocation/assembly module TamB domain-containing protein [Aliiroseovarius sp. F20344]MCK0143497.1 translocation/assembly module TamB domain-containing protein [Aliiroseovarius sp. F20344]